MRPRNVTKPVRPPRVNRSSTDALQLHAEDSGHLWAVSYADFLMVLLSFFIIFFSVDKNKRSNLVIKIASQLKSAGKGNGNGKEGSSGSGTSTAAGSGVGTGDMQMTAANVAALKQKIHLMFPSQMITLKEQDEKVMVDFPDDFYDLGEYNLNLETEKQVSEFLQLLKPYANSISIGFIGHTDKIPVRIIDGRNLESNVDVSVMRASRALNIALKNSFNPAHLYAIGAGDHVRSTRSLSIIVKPFSGDLL